MRNWLARLVPLAFSRLQVAPKLNVVEIHSYEDYLHHSRALELVSKERWLFERSLFQDLPQQAFTLDGFCFVCKQQVAFLVDFLYSGEQEGMVTPNWRERLLCPHCQLNNRMRAVVQIFEEQCTPQRRARIYITEQMTALHNALKVSYPGLIGSEHLGTAIALGKHNAQGIRNEDLTQLSFANESLDVILSFDVFEHIPDYKTAWMECYRSLKPGGSLIFSVPFIKNAKETLIRAIMSSTGEVTHLLPPEYHGDPINTDGCLCFYHFGWDILTDLKAIGFHSAFALTYWSKELGYLGGEQLLFIAVKAQAH